MADEEARGALVGAGTGAATGAAVGSVVPVIGTAIGAVAGAVIGGVGGFVSGKGAAAGKKAAQKAALERQARAQDNYNRTANIINPASMQALMGYDQAIEVQNRNITRQEKLIDQIDPTIIEASQQALKLLRGQEASTLNPARNARNQQRQQLVNQLRAQLGPGAETSTAGIQALNKFDSETQSLMAGAQQQAIQGLGNTYGQFSAYRPNMGNEATTLGNLMGGRANVSYQQAQILSNAYQGVIGNAGASQVGPMMAAQYQQQLGNQISQTGAQIGGMMLSSYGGGAGKVTQADPASSITTNMNDKRGLSVMA